MIIALSAIIIGFRNVYVRHWGKEGRMVSGLKRMYKALSPSGLEHFLVNGSV